MRAYGVLSAMESGGVVTEVVYSSSLAVLPVGAR